MRAQMKANTFLAGCLTAGVMLLAPTLASAQRITSDFDKTATFTGYQTYTLSRGQVPPGANPLMVQRVEAAIANELSAIGLLRVETGADLSVIYHASTSEDVRVDTWGYAPRWGGGQVSVTRILNAMLIVDVSEATSKNLLWRATATDTVSDNPQKNEKKIHEAVEEMFERYPTAQN